MKIDPNLLVEQEWTGTFFPPERQDLSFAGRLRHSPTDGLRLEFARPLSVADRDLAWAYLHGHTSTGIPLTLVGEFSAKGDGFAWNHGMSYWTSTGYPFNYVIFGYHFKDSDKFDAFDFSVSGVQEFFAPKGMKSLIPHSSDDIVSARCDAGELKVIHSSTFTFVGDNLKAFFHSKDTTALDELQASYIDICARNPEFHPFLRMNTDYLFRFIPEKGINVLEARKVIESVADLFAMLSFEPAKPAHISATARDEGGNPHPMTIFVHMTNDAATIERCIEKPDFHNLPLNSTDVDLGALLSNWMDRSEGYETISSLLQNKVNVISSHEIHGNIVLAATQLEGMALQAGANSRKDKYEYGTKNHASDILRKKLSGLLGCPLDDIGEKISDLRNEIAHVGRPKSLLGRISRRQQYIVSIALQAVVVGYALEQIGVSARARDKYQNSLINGF